MYRGRRKLWISVSSAVTSVFLCALILAPTPVAAHNYQNANTVNNIKNAIQNAITAAKVSSLEIKEYVLDPLNHLLKTSALQGILGSMTQFVTSGFEGNPVFVQNLDNLIASERDNAQAHFMQSDILSGIHPEFQSAVRAALEEEYAQERDFAKRSKTTLDTAEAAKLQAAYQGGELDWSLFYKAMNPKNNTLGATQLASEELNKKLTTRIRNELEELGWGEGFFPKKSCGAGTGGGGSTQRVSGGDGGAGTTEDDIVNAPLTERFIAGGTGDSLTKYQSAQLNSAFNSDFSDSSTQPPTTFSSDTFDPGSAPSTRVRAEGSSVAAPLPTGVDSTFREDCVVQTPAKFLTEIFLRAADSGREALLEADELNEVIAQIFGGFGLEAITGIDGLLGLSSGGLNSLLGQLVSGTGFESLFSDFGGVLGSISQELSSVVQQVTSNIGSIEQEIGSLTSLLASESPATALTGALQGALSESLNSFSGEVRGIALAALEDGIPGEVANAITSQANGLQSRLGSMQQLIDAGSSVGALRSQLQTFENDLSNTRLLMDEVVAQNRTSTVPPATNNVIGIVDTAVKPIQGAIEFEQKTIGYHSQIIGMITSVEDEAKNKCAGKTPIPLPTNLQNIRNTSRSENLRLNGIVLELDDIRDRYNRATRAIDKQQTFAEFNTLRLDGETLTTVSKQVNLQFSISESIAPAVNAFRSELANITCPKSKEVQEGEDNTP